MTLIAITNPSDTSAEAEVYSIEAATPAASPRSILNNYGDKLENGAQVALITDNDKVFQYIATRVGSSIALRNNNGFAENAEKRVPLIDQLDTGGGPGARGIIVSAFVPLASEETFTAFGLNDDDEPFVTVFVATEDKAVETAKKAAVVDSGYEHLVKVTLLLKGDRQDLSNESLPTSD